jgi:hypothetical protein
MQNEEMSQMNATFINEWLERNLQNMEAATINAPACWYDGTDGTCSA